MKKVSVVMAYYNRKNLLLKTLESIREHTEHDNFEIIIVDDASSEEERLEDIIGLFDFDIILHRILPKEKTHINSCIPYNKGFSLASGDIVIVQNPECFHSGDVISEASKMEEGQYLSYHCYSLSKDETELIQRTKFERGEKPPIVLNERAISFDGDSGYYVHKVFRPDAMHFCTAITRSDLDKLGGFDERFAQGYAFDDREFFDRVLRLGLQVIHKEYPMVFHQNHYGEHSKNHLSEPNNSNLYFGVTQKESKIHNS
jgi:GT2 family glycosyltransferase